MDKDDPLYMLRCEWCGKFIRHDGDDSTTTGPRDGFRGGEPGEPQLICKRCKELTK